MGEVKKPTRSFRDLDVYQGTYKAMLSVFKHILPNLPKEEEYDLKASTPPVIESDPEVNS